MFVLQLNAVYGTLKYRKQLSLSLTFIPPAGLLILVFTFTKEFAFPLPVGLAFRIAVFQCLLRALWKRTRFPSVGEAASNPTLPLHPYPAIFIPICLLFVPKGLLASSHLCFGCSWQSGTGFAKEQKGLRTLRQNKQKIMGLMVPLGGRYLATGSFYNSWNVLKGSFN